MPIPPQQMPIFMPPPAPYAPPQQPQDSMFNRLMDTVESDHYLLKKMVKRMEEDK